MEGFYTVINNITFLSVVDISPIIDKVESKELVFIFFFGSVCCNVFLELKKMSSETHRQEMQKFMIEMREKNLERSTLESIRSRIDNKQECNNIISKIQMLLIKYSSMKNTKFYKEIHDVLSSTH
jgi:hypothetical protein